MYLSRGEGDGERIRIMSDRTLILNGDGSVWDVARWEDVYSNILLPITNFDIKNNLQVVKNFIWAEYDDPVRLKDGATLPRPAVVMMPRFHSVQRRQVRFSRWNVFLRDRYQCQYCGVQCGFGENMSPPELEHVNPRKNGGYSTFENTVTSCQSCNARKGHLSLDEFSKRYGLRLLRKPFRPDYMHPARFMKYLTIRNVKHWIVDDDHYIPDAKFFASVMRVGQNVRQAINEIVGD